MPSLVEYASFALRESKLGVQYWTLLPWRRSKEALAVFANAVPAALTVTLPFVTGQMPNPGDPMIAPVYAMPVKYMGSTAPEMTL